MRDALKVIQMDHQRRRPPTTVNMDDTITFPAKLRLVLSNPELSHIVSWLPHGCAWKIHQSKQFVDIVMPRYFEKQSKLTSFTRQVNGWGFKRVTQGADRNAYYNEYFLRDYPHLMNGMKRRRVGGDQDSVPGESEQNYQQSLLKSSSSPQGQPLPQPRHRIVGRDVAFSSPPRSGPGYITYPPPESSPHFLPSMTQESNQRMTGHNRASVQKRSFESFASYPGFQYAGDEYLHSFDCDVQRTGQSDGINFPLGATNPMGLVGSANLEVHDIVSPIPSHRMRKRSILSDELSSNIPIDHAIEYVIQANQSFL